MQDGHPPLGWQDTAAYLVLPVLLIVSQYVSMEIMKPPQVEKWISFSVFHCFSSSDSLTLNYSGLTDRWSHSKEYTSCFQVSTHHDWLLLFVCSFRIIYILVRFFLAMSLNWIYSCFVFMYLGSSIDFEEARPSIYDFVPSIKSLTS